MTETISTTVESEAESRPQKTNIGWIPEEWHYLKIGDIIDFLTGFAFKSKDYSDEGIKLLRGANIKRGNLDWSEGNTAYWKKISPKLEKYELEAGDLVIAMDGSLVGRSYGHIKEEHLPALLLQRVARIRSNSINVDFLKVWIGSTYFTNYCDSVKTVTAIPHISSTDIKNFRIALPKRSEQDKIADCYNQWENSIALLDKLIQQKELRKKGLTQQLLSGKKRLPGFSGEWKEEKFKAIADRVNRKNSEGNDNVVTISAQRGFVRQEDFFKKRVASKTLLNYTLVQKGEYCYNKSYSQGYPMGAFKRLDDFDKAVVTTLYICFSLKDTVDSHFMNHYFEAGKMIPGLMRVAQEGGRAHGLLNIGLEDFFNLTVKLPLIEEQKAISNVLNTSAKEIELLKEKLEKLKTQKKGLMQVLLMGKKRLI